jgi:hypothetical protein
MERHMERDQNSAQFEWVNVWAEASKPSDLAAPAAETIAAEIAAEQPMVVRRAPAISGDQLMRDIAEIERTRDALAAMPVPVYGRRRTQALTLVAPRTSDPVPVVVGGVLALVMLTVFGAAAAMTKLAR